MAKFTMAPSPGPDDPIFSQGSRMSSVIISKGTPSASPNDGESVAAVDGTEDEHPPKVSLRAVLYNYDGSDGDTVELDDDGVAVPRGRSAIRMCHHLNVLTRDPGSTEPRVVRPEEGVRYICSLANHVRLPGLRIEDGDGNVLPPERVVALGRGTETI